MIPVSRLHTSLDRRIFCKTLSLNKSRFMAAFQIKYFDEEKTRWSLSDRFGNVLIPERKGSHYNYISINREHFYLIVEEEGKKDAYILHSSETNPEESYVYKFPESAKITGFTLNYQNPNLIFLRTERGECLASAQDGKRKSDYYSLITDQNHEWFYHKNVRYGNYQTTLVGPIDLNGNVGSLCYDTFFEKNRDVVTKKSKNGGYDIINTDEIKEDLKLYASEKRKLQAKAKNKQLAL